jgi:hypothetical protein
MPFITIMIPEKTVSRFNAAFSAGAAIMTKMISATSITVKQPRPACRTARPCERHDLGVVHDGEHDSDEDGPGYSSHRTAHPDQEAGQQDDPGRDRPSPRPPRHPFRCHAEPRVTLCRRR